MVFYLLKEKIIQVFKIFKLINTSRTLTLLYFKNNSKIYIFYVLEIEMRQVYDDCKNKYLEIKDFIEDAIFTYPFGALYLKE